MKKLYPLFVQILLAMTPFLIVGGVIALGTKTQQNSKADGLSAAAYTPQPQRNAEYIGTPEGLTAATIQNIAKNAGFVVINKIDHRNDTAGQIVDANNLVKVAQQYDNSSLAVSPYYMMQYWTNTFSNNFAPYNSSFKQSWLMINPNTGTTIPFYGIGGAAAAGDKPIGNMIDLTNPDYQSWLYSSIQDWLKRAPFKAFAFDETNALLGQNVRHVVADGQTDYNDLLCTKGSPLDAQGNCDKVNAFNNAMQSIVDHVAGMMHAVGGKLNYNGVAPSASRGPTRNTNILNNTAADYALNESFCYDAAANDKTNAAARFNSLSDDIKMMIDEAARGKGIWEVVNYQNTDKNNSYGAYCVAGFMMGWQPGYDWLIYHQNYNQDLSGQYPLEPELNLNLGIPTGQFVDNGAGLLIRHFHNGFVAVNSGDSSVTLSVPAGMVEFSGGKAIQTYNQAANVAMAARSGRFFLSSAFLSPNPPAGSSGASGGHATPQLTPPAKAGSVAAGSNIQSSNKFTNAKSPGQVHKDNLLFVLLIIFGLIGVIVSVILIIRYYRRLKIDDYMGNITVG